ncbi:unnamed protein product [Amoebophrya sp. A25]|nr:unnamed protein product [Amoebophrya sp. A25]|eukprot:GSA25T00009340001.1
MAVLSSDALDEREALRAIFGMEFSSRTENEWAIAFPPPTCIDDDFSSCTKLVVHLSNSYPEEPPVAEIERAPTGLDVQSTLESLPFNAGEPCVYDWACELRGKLDDLRDLFQPAAPANGMLEPLVGDEVGDFDAGAYDPEALDDYFLSLGMEQAKEYYEEGSAGGATDYEAISKLFEQEKLYKSLSSSSSCSGSKNYSTGSSGEAASGITIVHGEPFTEKKSTFQCHCAVVRSEADVTWVLEKLYEDNKIRRATHNQYAWRLRDAQGHLRADNNDDGEAGAGRKIAELLQMKKVENVLCVVSRWFGGVLMGPDRFKAIGRCAADLLDSKFKHCVVGGGSTSGGKKK